MKPILKQMIMVVVLFLMLTGCTKSVEQQIAEQLELGQKYLVKTDYEQAIVAFNKVIELEPNELEAYIGLISAYEGLENVQKAENVMNDCHDRFLFNRDMQLDESLIYKIVQRSISFFDTQNMLEEKYTFLLRLSESKRGNDEYDSLLDDVKLKLFQYYISIADEYMASENLDIALEYLSKAYEIIPDSDIDIRIKAIENGGQYRADDGQIYDAFGNIAVAPQKTEEELRSIISSRFPRDSFDDYSYLDYDMDGRYELFAEGKDMNTPHIYHIYYCSSDGETVVELENIYNDARFITIGSRYGNEAAAYYIAFSYDNRDTFSECYVYSLIDYVPMQIINAENIVGGETGLETFIVNLINEKYK